jgi:hypothetical protein
MVKSHIETFLRIKPGDKNKNSSEFSNSSTSTEINYELKNNFIEIRVPEEMRKGYVNNLKKSYEFKFTGIFDTNTSQEEIFENIGQKVIKK